MANASLHTTLAPLSFFLKDKDIAEIMINRPNELWFDNGKFIVKQKIDLSLKMLERMAHLIAAHSGQEINEQKPLLSAMLPGGHRVQLVLSPACKCFDVINQWQNTVSISIRKQKDNEMSLDDFEHQGGFNQMLASDDKILPHLKQLSQHKKYSQLFIDAVKYKKTILISGGTYSGKTTLLNMLLPYIDQNERVITIEDTPELRIPNENQVRLFYSRGMQNTTQVSAYDLLTASLRLRPDRIIMGELRDDDAVCWLQAVNTGHAGTLSTIHSDTPELAVQKLIDMVRLKYPFQSEEHIKQYIYKVVDLIIQIKRNSRTGQRYISQILILKE